MKAQMIAVFLIASVCGAQTPTSAESGTRSAPALIAVPQGTTVALTLLNPIRSKTSKPGDAVRAVVAFPVTVGTQVAIPAGTYVQGTIDAVAAHPGHGHLPNVKIHFTSLLFVNGYLVSLDAMSSDAFLTIPKADSEPTYELADARDGAPPLGRRFAVAGQNPPAPPTLPPLPQVGPSRGALIGTSIGISAATLAAILIWAHHSAKSLDYVVFDSGWQFAMVLSRPVTLESAQVIAAARMRVQH